MNLQTLYRADGTPHDRYVVVGTSGSGKSTLANRLAWHTDNHHIELDALHWLPDWQMRSPEAFRDLVASATARDRWVLDGNYSIARDIAWPRAEAILWLDLPFRVVMAQVLTRTVNRCLTRQAVCNGNSTNFRRAFLSRESIILWAATTWTKKRALYQRLLYQPEWRHIDVFRIGSKNLQDVEVRRGKGTSSLR